MATVSSSYSIPITVDGVTKMCMEVPTSKRSPVNPLQNNFSKLVSSDGMVAIIYAPIDTTTPVSQTNVYQENFLFDSKVIRCIKSEKIQAIKTRVLQRNILNEYRKGTVHNDGFDDIVMAQLHNFIDSSFKAFGFSGTFSVQTYLDLQIQFIPHNIEFQIATDTLKQEVQEIQLIVV